MDPKPSTSSKKRDRKPLGRGLKSKKGGSPNKGSNPNQNTILSLFKRQRESSIECIPDTLKRPKLEVDEQCPKPGDGHCVQDVTPGCTVAELKTEERPRLNKLSLSRRKKSFGSVANNVSDSVANIDNPGESSAAKSGKQTVEIQENMTASLQKPSVENTHLTDKKTVINGENEVILPVTGQEDKSESAQGDGNSSEVTYLVPYYLENFLLVLNSVIADEFYSDLFNDDDMESITKFNSLSDDGKKLYVRLFSRKFRWILKSKIAYPKIADDLTDALTELVSSGLVLDESKMDDLDDILRALPAPDVKSVAKTLRLNHNATREELVEAILQHSRKQSITSFFGQRSGGGTAAMITKKAKALLGHAYKLDKDSRYIFIRVIMLFALYKTQGDEDENAGGQALLFQMLTSNIGRVKYPEYHINRSSKIFTSRESLMLYGRALQSEADMFDAVENKEFDEALGIYREARGLALSLLADKQMLSLHQELPPFLRTYTAISVYTRVISMGVEVLQSRKTFQEAVEQLEWLLSLDLYHQGSLGRWYERLALNLDFHLKKPGEALDVIEKALGDPRVRTGRRYALWQRAQKICHSPSCKKLKHRWHEFAQDPMSFVQESPKTVIKCQRMSAVVPGDAGAWIMRSVASEEGDGVEETVYLRRVEDVVLAYYKDRGYPEGLHGEGGTFRCLFGIFLWDLIYKDDIPDVFYTPYQTSPLDLGTDQFYLQRKTLIDERLGQIKGSSIDELESMVKDIWDTHKDTVSSAINWERFESVEHVCGLVRCMGGHVICGILERMAVNLRHTSGGVPDLVVWNPDAGTLKVVEVKGPNDRLSTKQILWIDYLCTLGVDTEVCHVEAIGTKRI